MTRIIVNQLQIPNKLRTSRHWLFLRAIVRGLDIRDGEPAVVVAIGKGFCLVLQLAAVQSFYILDFDMAFNYTAFAVEIRPRKRISPDEARVPVFELWFSAAFAAFLFVCPRKRAKSEACVVSKYPTELALWDAKRVREWRNPWRAKRFATELCVKFDAGVFT